MKELEDAFGFDLSFQGYLQKTKVSGNYNFTNDLKIGRDRSSLRLVSGKAKR